MIYITHFSTKLELQANPRTLKIKFKLEHLLLSLLKSKQNIKIIFESDQNQIKIIF